MENHENLRSEPGSVWFGVLVKRHPFITTPVGGVISMLRDAEIDHNPSVKQRVDWSWRNRSTRCNRMTLLIFFLLLQYPSCQQRLC